MRTTKVLTVVAGLSILVALFSIVFYIFQPQTKAKAGQITAQQSPNNIEKTRAVHDLTESTLVPDPTGAVLEQTIGDITIEITSAKIIKTGVEIGFCYTTQDSGDWYPTPEHLFYGSYEIYPDELEFTTEKRADGKNYGQRCALVRYRIEEVDKITTPIIFSIRDVNAVPREGFPCERFQERLDTNPKAKELGLEVNCTETEDFHYSVELAGFSKSTNKDSAQELVDEITNGVLYGPWEFTITNLDQ